MADTFRPHVQPHLRSVQEQTLDALLRIEELLTTLVARAAFPAASPSAGQTIVSQEDLAHARSVADAAAKQAEKVAYDKPKGGRGGPRRL